MREPDESSTGRAAPFWQPNAPARVVVAEDDRDLRELIMTKLLDDGHEVYGASTAPELLHLLADGGSTIPPVDGADLIVLDQHLPGLTGMDIIRRLRGAGCQIPLLLMTAFPTNDLRREAKQYRVPILVKPFPLSDLSNAALLLILMHSPSHEKLGPSARL